MSRLQSLAATPIRSTWGALNGSTTSHKGRAAVLSGSIIMLLGTVLVSALNFGYNVAMARMMGPAAFGHVTAAVTMLMLASAVTLSFQLVCAKFVARNETAGAKQNIYRSLLRRGWAVSLCIGLMLVLLREPISSYLRLPDSWIVVILAFGIAGYVPLGVKRGAMQGMCAFPRLSANFILESLVRFAAGIALVLMGYGIFGAVGAISASVVVAYLLSSSGIQAAETSQCEPASFREGMQAIVFFVGQVLINNIDILLVKHFFAPEQAGHYAAVALVGRVLYFAAWSVVSAMFPVSAAAKPREDDRGVLLLPLMFVFGMSVVFIGVLTLFSDLIIGTIFGANFHEARSLLSLYAAATALYALSVVLMAYEMSRQIANTGWLQLLFSGILIVAIWLFHDTLQQVILVQIVLMVLMLGAVSLPFLRRFREQTVLPQEEAA
jgi:O-antigen/teichoic acid export membrane protein